MNDRRGVKCVLISMVFVLCSFRAMGASPTHTIQSPVLGVTIDTEFPRVLGYTWRANGAILYGQEESLSDVTLNGESHTPTVDFRRAASHRAGYQLQFPSLDVTLTVEMAVVDNVLNFRITRIEEKGSFRVRSIEFPNHSLVSIRSTQPKAEIATARTTGHWNKIAEAFIPLSEKAIDADPVNQTYVVIHSDKLAATLDNNVIHYERTRVQTVGQGDDKTYGIWNGVWTYREIDSEIVDLPWSKVIVVDDRNGDDSVDWQDGAIGYREKMAIPVGADDIRSSISYISFNGGSVAIAPFLRALEDAKQLHLMLDGFGQMIELKGYQSEGHDAAHPDCAGNYNTRAGGLKDLRTLLSYAPKYNLKPGVHINVSESYPEAKNFSDTILKVPHEGGWAWYDRALRMDYRKDILSGSLDTRLDQMHAELPGLTWVYVDVYGDHYGNDFWAAHKLGTKLNDNGWLVASEYFGPMERQLLWVHHLYAVPETRLIRFIKNHVADIFKHDPLLKGAKALGVGGWENNYDFNKVVETFFSDNLPTKYMQHFPIVRMTDHRVDFEGGVHVDNSNGWKLYKDDALISDGTVHFIPWDPLKEKKVYHWNSGGGSSTWDVPASWSGTPRLKLYRLTRLGRVFVSDLAVSPEGKVTIDSEANTPYVVYRTAPPEQPVVWGEGGLVKDPGFSSEGFLAWRKRSTAPNTEHVTVEVDGNANALLTVNAAGTNGTAAAVAQRISGLTGGKTYTASAWVNVTGGRKAWIAVRVPRGSGTKNWVDRTELVRSEGRLKYRGTPFQRLAVVFDVPAGESQAALYLRADAGDPASMVQFDDVRITELAGKTPQGNHLLFEDFENVDEQWGPFVAAGGTDHTHLSELNPGHTQDTINGRFSLKNLNEGKTGEIYRTVQSTLKLAPNTRYRIGFDFINEQANFHVAVKTRDGGDAGTALDEAVPEGTGQFSIVFTTGDHPDYYVAFATEKSHGRLFVIDDFFIGKP